MAHFDCVQRVSVQWQFWNASCKEISAEEDRSLLDKWIYYWKKKYVCNQDNYRIYSNKRPYSNKRLLPSWERNINWPKPSNNRPSPGPTWTIPHHISGNSYFSFVKFGQCLLNQETDFLSVESFPTMMYFDGMSTPPPAVHVPSDAPQGTPVEIVEIRTPWNAKQGLTQALWNMSDNNFPFLYHNCCVCFEVFTWSM